VYKDFSEEKIVKKEKKEFVINKNGLFAKVDIDVYGETIKGHNVKLADEESLKGRGFSLGGVNIKMRGSDLMITLDDSMPDFTPPKDTKDSGPVDKKTSEPYYKFDPARMKELNSTRLGDNYYRLFFRKPGTAMRYGKPFHYHNSYYVLYNVGKNMNTKLKGLSSVVVRADILKVVYDQIQDGDTYRTLYDRIKAKNILAYSDQFVYNAVRVLHNLCVLDLNKADHDKRIYVIKRLPNTRWIERYWVTARHMSGK